MESKLPKNWVKTSPLEISKIIRGVSYGKSDAFQFEFDNSCLILRGGNIQDGEIVDGKDNVYVSVDLIKNEQFIQKHDVVIVGSTGSKNLIGKAATSLFESDKISFGAFLMNIRASETIDKRYFSYYFQTNYYREAIRNLAGGVNINNIRKEYIENLYFPLPPLAEQNRIVEKLDRLFAQQEILKTSMAKVPLLLKDFHQQVLTQAVTGKLTEEWRKGKELDSTTDLLKKIEIRRKKNATITLLKKLDEIYNDNSKSVIYNIPSEWKEINLDRVCEKFSYGTSTKSDNEGEYVVLRMGNLQNGKIDWSDLKFTSEKSEFEKYKLEKGDVLFNRTNSPELVGKTSVYEGEKESIYASYLIKIWNFMELNSYYLNYVLNSNFAKKWCSEVKSDGVSQSNINAQKLSKFTIPFPSPEEQLQIVRRVEKLFAKADAIEEQYKSLKSKIDTLPQAILHKAFKGELSEQLDSDGDAIELLKQIQELKISAVKPKKATTKKVKNYPEGDGVLGMVAEK
ncbi:restriction endonuclease subunit S [Flavobacterium algicola]|uniref:restriction endonuclease subunit S n=1 Tax=Flavobacterium algicola TaxID=556529 RepID=UPI001EFDEBC7|nr:restriction endonuclease subunit S [Flavobacterium algicola]MCG9792799.1 restriction endonuclease subunit S [Flavobacterium algicola]